MGRFSLEKMIIYLQKIWLRFPGSLICPVDENNVWKFYVSSDWLFKIVLNNLDVSNQKSIN